MSKSKSLFFLFLFFLFLFSPSVCGAVTYTVSKNCDGISNCFTTIQAGVDSANVGDTVLVKAGTYHETVKISKSGTSTNPITLSGYPNERPIKDGHTDATDILFLFSSWLTGGSTTYQTREDIVRDGKVNSLDFEQVIKNWER